MKNIHILQTDKPSRLYYNGTSYKDPNSTMAMDWFISSAGYKPQNIYITSDEEIKDGDWVISIEGIWKNTITKITGEPITDVWKKIILTTDQDLIKDGVQAIDDEFLEWFVKNPSCEEVKVRKKPKVHFIVKGKGVRGFNQGYKIIIPKEEPKQECFVTKCMQLDAEIAYKSLPKQETLTEAAENYADFSNDYVPMSFGGEFNETTKRDFIEGAKWQAERSYSEEEVEDLIYKVCGTVARLQGITLNGNHIDTAYKQFRKK